MSEFKAAAGAAMRISVDFVPCHLRLTKIAFS